MRAACVRAETTGETCGEEGPHGTAAEEQEEIDHEKDLRIGVRRRIAGGGDIATNQGTIPEADLRFSDRMAGEDIPFKLISEVASASCGVKPADEENAGH